MHLYLIRHADPDYTVDGLTSRGHEEARALAERLKSHGLDYLYASQTKRAIPTAEPVSRLLDIPIIEQTWIIEPSHLTVEQDGQSYVLWDTFWRARARDPRHTHAIGLAGEAPFQRPTSQGNVGRIQR